MKERIKGAVWMLVFIAVVTVACSFIAALDWSGEEPNSARFYPVTTVLAAGAHLKYDAGGIVVLDEEVPFGKKWYIRTKVDIIEVNAE